MAKYDLLGRLKQLHRPMGAVRVVESGPDLNYMLFTRDPPIEQWTTLLIKVYMECLIFHCSGCSATLQHLVVVAE